MTDRVQPGAIDSIIRNDELAQVFGQFSEGWIKPGAEPPTPAAVRRPEIDETALNGFSLISTSGFDITIDAGEGFVGGWCARDVKTVITVPSNTTSTIILAWSLDSVFDPQTDADRDSADEVRVDLRQNVDPEYPNTELFKVVTDSNTITDTIDQRRLGPTVVANSLEATEAIIDPTGNRVTDLSTPVRVTEEASTFTEPDVTLTTNNTLVNNGSVSLIDSSSDRENTSAGLNNQGKAVADINDDGQAEVIFQDGSGNDTTIYSVDTDTTSTIGQSTRPRGSGDVDGDGVPEVVLRGNGYYDGVNDNIVDLSFTTDSFSLVACDDFDNDGIDEIAYVDFNDNLKIADVDASSIIDPGVDASGGAISIYSGDVDGDGVPEIVYNTTAGGDPIAVFDVVDSAETVTSRNDVILGTFDIDNDGADEIIISTIELKAFDFVDKTTTTLQSGVKTSTPSTIVDIDADGDTEVIFFDNDNSEFASYEFASDSYREDAFGGGDTNSRLESANPGSGASIAAFSNNSRNLSYIAGVAAETSGDVLVEFDSAVPADISSYDLATFQRTLENETVSVDVEDGGGTVLFSNISKDFNISSVSPLKNVKLRANLSRTDTANNPKVDYLARRFTR
jgi:hypothetical protein